MLLLQLITADLRVRIPIIVKDSSHGLDPTYKIDRVDNNFPLLCTESGPHVPLDGRSERFQTGVDQPVIAKLEKEQRSVMNDKPLSGNLIWSN